MKFGRKLVAAILAGTLLISGINFPSTLSAGTVQTTQSDLQDDTDETPDTEQATVENVQPDTEQEIVDDVQPDTEIVDEDELTEPEIPEKPEFFDLPDNNGISLFAVENSGTVNIPGTLAELQAMGTTTFLISNYEDVKNLQALCTQSSLEGYTFQFGQLKLPGEKPSYEWNLTGANGFTGFGSKEYPFEGTLESYYSMESQTFNLDKSLFAYVGNSATVARMQLAYQVNASIAGGIANYYVLEKYDTQTGTTPQIQYNNVCFVKNFSLKNYGIADENGEKVTGGMYGHVVKGADYVGPADAEFLIDGSGVDISSLELWSEIAGGVAGKIGEGVTVKVSSAVNVAKRVGTSKENTGAAGGIVGVMTAGSTFLTTADFVIANELEGSDVQSTSTTDTMSVGGLIGKAVDAVITSKYKITKQTDIKIRGGAAGGFVGQTQNCKVTISGFVLDDGVYAGIGAGHNTWLEYAGGVIGVYRTDADSTRGKAFASISNIGNTNKKRIAAGQDTNKTEVAFTGGIVGLIEGNDISVTDLNCEGGNAFYPYMAKDACNAVNLATWNLRSLTGGIAGKATGQRIEVSNARLDFGTGEKYYISGMHVGGLFGYVGESSKVKASDITILGLGIHDSGIGKDTFRTCGGLFGSVQKGAVIALAGQIDLSGVSYDLAGKISVDSLKNTSKGYIAGYQNEALIYLETGAKYIRNTEAEDKENDVWKKDIYGTDYRYIIDDIGNYGALYRNIEITENGTTTKVIDYDAVSAEGIVTGQLAQDSDGYFLIQSNADVLRLAIALNTFDADSANYPLRFAQNCFADNAGNPLPVNAADLLQSNYRITTDLNFKEVGVFSLCRNDSVDKWMFTGTLEGKAGSKSPVITLDMVSKQQYGGLFPSVGSGAVFRNFDLAGNAYYVKNFGGIAAYATGRISVDNVDTGLHICTSSNSVTISTTSELYYYGGMFARYNLAGETISVTDCKIAPEITNVRIQQMAGGMIGWLQTGNTNVCQISVSDIIIGTKITAASRFNEGTIYTNNIEYRNNQARVAGAIALVSATSNSALYSNSALGGSVADVTYARASLRNITISDSVIDMGSVAANRDYVHATGGLLGYDWNNVEVTSENITVTGDTRIQSLGHVGGLVTTFAGKWDFSGKTKLEQLTMNNCSPKEQSFCGFLMGDARYAIVTLVQAEYTIASGKVQETGYTDFDEIAGVNLELGGNNVNINNQGIWINYSGGGIVNIIAPEFANMTAPSYGSYSNQVINTTNPYTRYYYNLFLDSDYTKGMVGISGDEATIDSAEDLMIWHLYQYVSSKLLRFITPYFSSTPNTSTTTWKFDGTMDLKGYSFYATYPNRGKKIYSGGTSTPTIKLYAEDIYQQENAHLDAGNKKVNYAEKTQHYLMHASIFWNANSINVSGLTIQGTAGNLGTDSGALVARELTGTSNISKITLDGVRIADYIKDCSGLLIARVPYTAIVWAKNQITISEIKTTGYDGKKLAAGALIGSVGRNDSRNNQIIFSSMQVEDGPGKVFKYASFLCAYNYSGDTNNNKSFGIYTFTKAEATAGKVTYGSEIGIAGGVCYAGSNEKVAENENAKDYLPYVHNGNTTKYIYVNPQNGNITEGCGTYEDPYIINNARQLVSLFCYLEDIENYDLLFKIEGMEWTVNQFADGSVDGRCHNSKTEQKYWKDNTYNKDFPTRDELRTAYYQVTADIDLTNVNDVNDYISNATYGGIGTTTYPFAGVFVGKEKTTGQYPSITMPNTAETVENYGLFKYIKGAVIKDLNLVQPTKDATKLPIYVTNCAGGVAAQAIGGDNIIDNVKVSLNFTVIYKDANDNGKISNLNAGAYVGMVQRGSVILRNLEAEDFSGFSIISSKDSAEIWKHSSYAYRSNMVIGFVEDGCVLAEKGISASSAYNVDKPLLLESDFGITDSETSKKYLSYSFPILNTGYLETTGTDSKITVTGSEEDGFVLNIHDNRQLEIAALALNSDAFSIYNTGNRDTSHYSAYDYTAVCRKATYQNVGCGYQAAPADYPADWKKAVTEDDNIGYYPYLYQYMDFSAIKPAGGSRNDYEYSMKIDSTDAAIRSSLLNYTWDDSVLTTYQLDGDKTYDLSVFGRSFRGFGSLYQLASQNYSVFKANFDGQCEGDAKPAVVILAMKRDWDSGITTTGMFNDLQTERPGGFYIRELTIQDSTFESVPGGSPATGAIAGHVSGQWTFQEITLQRTKARAADTYDIRGAGYSGGLIGYVNYSTDVNTTQSIVLDRCTVKGTSGSGDDREAYVAIHSGNMAGGLVGYVAGTTEQWKSTYFGKITVKDCSTAYTDIELVNQEGSAGGFIGRIGNCYNDLQSGGTTHGRSMGVMSFQQTDFSIYAIDHVNIWTDKSGANQAIGGLVGRVSSYNGNNPYNIDIHGVRLRNLAITCKGAAANRYASGGLIGDIWVYDIQIADVRIQASTIDTTGGAQPAGGLIGRNFCDNTTIQKIRLEEVTVHSGSGYAGGFIGNCEVANGTLTITDNSLSGCTIQSDKSVAAGGIVGANGQSPKEYNLSDIEITQSCIYNHVAEAADGTITLNTTSEGDAAGGLLGIDVSPIPKLNISNIHVGDDTRIAGGSAGGLAGWLSQNDTITLTGDIYIGCHRNAGAVEEDTARSVIYALRNAGGLYGKNYVSAKESSSADIRIYNTNIGAYQYADNSSYDVLAGGVAGYRGVNGEVKYDALEIRDCVIAVNHAGTNYKYNVAAGGIYGEMLGGNLAYLYQPILTDNSIGYMEKLTTLQALAQKEANPAADDTEVCILHKKADTVYWKNENLFEDNVAEYSCRIGNYIGYRAGGTAYILKPELSYASEFHGSRPAIDCGNADGANNWKTDDTVNYGLGFPYTWRQYVHIIYFEPEAFDIDALLTDSSLQQIAGLNYTEKDYLLGSVDSFVTKYKTESTASEAYLNKYDLKMNLYDKSRQEVSPQFILDHYYAPADPQENEKKSWIHTLGGTRYVYVDGYTAQEVVDSVLAILTNAGAVNATGIVEVNSVPARLYPDGKITADSGRTAAETSIQVNSDGRTISTRKSRADEYVESGADKYYTISLLTFSYGWKGVDGKLKYHTIYIPVFAVERIAFYSDLYIMEGEQYSLKKASHTVSGTDAVSYQDSVVIATDSTYTYFAEYAYGNETRQKDKYASYVVEKNLAFYNGETDLTPATIPDKMKLTLVDALTGKAYYYTVHQEEGSDPVTSIPFTAFLDEEGNAWKNRSMSELSDENLSSNYTWGGKDMNACKDGLVYTLEQFFIYVDSSECEKTKQILTVRLTTDGTLDSVYNFLDRTEDNGITMTMLPGAELSLLGVSDSKTAGTEGLTYIDGTISRQTTVSVEAAIGVKADKEYWDLKNSGDKIIDSQNADKYLDVAVYLMDSEGGYVSLPSGTSITFEGEDPFSITNKTVTYMYKDHAFASVGTNAHATLPLNQIVQNLTDATGIKNLDGEEIQDAYGKAYSNYCKFTLDFETADLDNYIDHDYSLYMELRRTSNPEYPLEEERLDWYKVKVQSIGEREMAVALEPDNYMDLGINVYNQPADVEPYTIDFKTKIDFTKEIYSEAKDIQSCADKSYLITYRLKKKGESKTSNTGYEYYSLTEDDMQFGDDCEFELSSGDLTGTGDKNVLTYNDNYNGETVYQVWKTFTFDEIQQGTKDDENHSQPYLVWWDMSLSVDTSQVTDKDLSNYEVEVTVMPLDKDFAGAFPPDDKVANQIDSQVDHFIFTIGKLKNDL